MVEAGELRGIFHSCALQEVVKTSYALRKHHDAALKQRLHDGDNTVRINASKTLRDYTGEALRVGIRKKLDSNLRLILAGHVLDQVIQPHHAWDMWDLLIKSGFPIPQTFSNMIKAAEIGSLEYIKTGLNTHFQNMMDHPDRYGRTMLTRASQRGHTHVVQYLLDHNANVDKPLGREANKNSPLACALHFSHFDTAKVNTKTLSQKKNEQTTVIIRLRFERPGVIC